MQFDGLELMAQSKYHMGYSRWIEEKDRYETWDDSVARIMAMHKVKYKEKLSPILLRLMDSAEQSYLSKEVLGAQRALQFGGEQIFKHEARMYNCSSSYADRAAFFNECFYLLLCGCGVGFSVQQHHIAKLPSISKRSKDKIRSF